MGKYQSTKTFDGYSTAIRQHRAQHSHCQYEHGYDFKIKVWFEATELDDMNWIADFGGFKHNGIKDWFSYMFDHTLFIEENDPFLDYYQSGATSGLSQLRVIPTGFMGCEGIAKLVFDKLNDILSKTDAGRCRVVKVEVFEHERNSGIYTEI